MVTCLCEEGSRGLQGTIDTISNGFDIIRVHAYRQTVTYFGSSTCGTDQYWDPTRHSLQNGHAKALVKRGENEAASAGIEGRQVLIGHVAQQPYGLIKP